MLLFLIDRHERILDYRAPDERALLMPPGEFLGRLVEDVLPPPAGRQILDALRCARQQGHEQRLSYRLVLGGVERQYDARFVPMATSGMVTVLVDDVTESKQEEQTRRTKDDRLRALLSVLPDVVFVLDAEGRYIEAFGDTTLLYAPPSTIIGRRLDEVLPPDVARFCLAVVQRSITERVPQTIEYELELSGGPHWFEGRIAPVVDDGGKCEVVIWASRDISGRKRAEEARAAGEAKLRLMLETVPECVKLVGVNGQLLEMNPAGLAMLEVDTFEQIEGDLSSFVVEEDRGAFRELHRRVIAGESGELEFTVIGARGTRRRLHTVAVPFSDARGRLTLGVTRDVTQLRSRELDERRAQKMEMIGRLAGGVAHDFNNLLTVIIGYLDLISIETGSDGPEELVEIRKAAERAQELTGQLLSLARRQVITPRPVDVGVVVAGMERLLVRLLGEAIDVHVQVEPEIGHVHADPSQIEQIVMNLAINARDAMPTGGRLHIQVDRVELAGSGRRPAGACVRLRVTDTGHGIAAADRDRVFEPFYSTKPAGVGTGLGLATVLGIVEQSFGSVRVESAEGLGSTFEVLLPILDESTTAHSERIRIPLASVQSRGFDARRLLVVEDEPSLRALMTRVLTGAGHTVFAAGNGEEALRLLETCGDIDLLITDVVIPGMSGKRLAEEVARCRPATPCLFVSGYAEDVIARHGLVEEGIELLSKPFTPAQLLVRVERMFEP